jgi:tRNA A-37 threonylcarbamoyl transferase component Bud32
MAEVWEGQDAILRRAVAVKVLRTHLAADVTFVERFRREAVNAARVAHPCVVATYDAGVDEGTAYIVMELVQGQTLRQLLTASAPLDPGLAVAIALQIADALADAHRAGLVHRDIKPANILLCDDGGGLRVKVTDFGIAKVGADLGGDLTLVGTVLGTPKYLSPEQVEGGVEPDARSDLYSLGVVLFEMLTGRPPFDAATGMATALAHLRDPAPRLASVRPDVSAGLDAFVARLLEKSPADRPPTAVAVRRALDTLVREGLTSPGPVGSRPPPAADRGPAPDLGPTGLRPPLARPSGSASGAVPGPAQANGPASGAASGPAQANGAIEARPSALSGPVGPGRPRAPSPGRGVGPGRHVATGSTRVLPSEPPARSAARSAAGPLPAPPRRTQPVRRHRSGRVPGLVVAAIVLVAAIVAGILIADHGGAGGGGGGTAATASTPIAVQGVTVWLNTTAHTLDNPAETHYVFDHDLSTAWETDLYGSATFGGYYSGEGLAIHLTGTHTLARLVVDSPTKGWAASTYVSATEPARGSAVTAWGAPTASATDIQGNVTFDLEGRTGSWVLLWLTNLGPSDQASIAEVTVH